MAARGGVSATSSQSTLRVVGRIGAGAEILPEFEQIPPEGIDEVELMLPQREDAVAFTVEGNSMYPRYNAGDVVVCGEREHDPQTITGQEAAVRTGDGKRYLKTSAAAPPPGPSIWESHNAPPIRDVTIEWAAPILLIMPHRASARPAR